MDSELYAKVKKSGRYCRSTKTRKKINLFLEAIKLGNVSVACRRHGVITKTYYFWWNRYKVSGFKLSALEPKSTRPKISPNKTKGRTLKWIKYYRKEFRYGPERIQMYLKLNHKIDIAQSTIGEIIIREKLRLRKNRTKKSNKHTKRYSLPWPGQRLQMDIKYVPRKIDDEQYYVFNAIDDCSRWRISRLYRNKGALEAVDFLRYVNRVFVFKIACIQLDNDTCFTHRLSPLSGDIKHRFELNAEEMGIRLKFIPPGEKELQGKVERLHRTDEDEFFWKVPYISFSNLEYHLERWVFEYNYERLHKELGWKTPADILYSKLVDQWAILTYIANGYRTLDWVWIAPELWPIPKRPDWLIRYLQFIDWTETQYLPTTEVPGYYTIFLDRQLQKS